MTQDEFGAPAPSRGGRQHGGNYVDSDGIERDRWDRPQLPHPETGELTAWTRATTLARTLEDEFLINQWKLRQAVHGLAKRPDLVALAASTPNDDDHRGELQKLADQAMEAAESSRGSNLGTSLHRHIAAIDRQTTAPRPLPPPLDLDVQAYQRTMVQYQFRVDPRYIERMTPCPAVGAAGTFDRLLLCPDGAWRVADLKTQKDHPQKYSGLSVAIQMAVYGNGASLWNAKDRVYEPFPEPMDRSYGIIIWLPVGRQHCEILPVDLARGAQLAGLADHVRDVRDDAKSLIGQPLPLPNGAPLSPLPDDALAASLEQPAPLICPTCGSPQPELHPQSGVCPDVWHGYQAGLNTMHRGGTDAQIGQAVLDNLPTGPGAAAEYLDNTALDARRIRLANTIANAVDRDALVKISQLCADIWDQDLQNVAAKRWAELDDRA